MTIEIRIPTEEEDQMALVQWMELRNILFAAIQNEVQTSFLDRRVARMQGSKAKKMGKKAGFPDFIIFKENSLPLFLELKRLKGGKVSEDQKTWHKILVRYGMRFVLVFGFDQARKAIEQYFRDEITRLGCPILNKTMEINDSKEESNTLQA